MEVIGNSAAEAPHGAGLPAAVVSGGLFPEAVFPFGSIPDGDDLDAMLPEDPFPDGEYAGGVFPEDPFPELLDDPFFELLSKDHLFADAPGAGCAAFGAGGRLPGAETPPASGLSLDDRVGAVKTLFAGRSQRRRSRADRPDHGTREIQKLGHRAAGQTCRRVRGEAAAGTS
jgi:hypothetical protein